MTPVLVIGGSAATRRRLAAYLPHYGCELTFAQDGAEGLMLARRGEFPIALLDWALPDMSGSEVCRELEANERTRGTKVIVVTSVDNEMDRIVAFELGAVDYVCEPVSPRELLLRMRVALEAKRGFRGAPPRDRYADLALDSEARRARVRDREVLLSPREFAILAALKARAGAVLTRETLRDTVWGDTGVSLRTVDASVKRLRHKLGRAGRSVVETVRGVGYRLSAAGANRGGITQAVNHS